MIGGLIDLLSIILFLLALVLLFKSKISDISNLIKRKLNILFLLFFLVALSFIVRIYIKMPELSLIFIIIFLFYIFDIERKINFNKKIDSIKRFLQAELIAPKLEQIKEEQSNFDKEKISLEKQKEKFEEKQMELENKKQELTEHEYELKEKASNLLKLEKESKKKQKSIQADRKKLNKEIKKFKVLQKKLKSRKR